MIMRCLWGYMYITTFATILIYVACIAAARADQIRKRTIQATVVTHLSPTFESLRRESEASSTVKQIHSYGQVREYLK